MLITIKNIPNVIPKQPIVKILVSWRIEYLMNSNKMGSHLGIRYLNDWLIPIREKIIAKVRDNDIE